MRLLHEGLGGSEDTFPILRKTDVAQVYIGLITGNDSGKIAHVLVPSEAIWVELGEHIDL